MKNKFKYLFKNTGLLFIGTFSSKVLVFLLVPLYTSVLTTAEYGSYDIVYTTIQLLVPILCLNVIEATICFTLEASPLEKKQIFTISVKYVTAACLVFICGVILCAQFPIFQHLRDYSVECCLFFISFIFNQFTVQYVRGLDDVKGISISGILGTATMIFFNILFLLYFKLGLRGYYYANILSFVVQTLYLAVHNRLDQYFLHVYKRNAEEKLLKKRLLAYSIPLEFNTLSWYVNSVSDRYTVTYFQGVEVNGIYSVAYKIPAILNAIQTVFIQAWQLSAIKEYKKDQREAFFRQIYKGSQAIMIILCSSLILGTKILAHILFAADFYEAWRFVPVLLLYIVFNTMSGVIGGVFAAVKDVKAFATSAIVGATVNIILNIVLVKYFGAQGAAVATVISSVVIWMMRSIYAKKYVDFKNNSIFYYLEYLILGIQIYVMIMVEQLVTLYALQILCLGTLLVLNYLELRKLRHKE